VEVHIFDGDDDIRTAARRFIRSSLAAPSDNAVRSPGYLDARESPADIESARAWQRRKAEAGWAALTWPVGFGGRGLGPLAQIVFDDEEYAAGAPPNVFTAGLAIVGPAIMRHGDREQQDRLLPPMITGEQIWCQMYSEPEAGSDLASIRTRARRSEADGGWRLTGTKTWISRSAYADRALVLARTGEAGSGRAGLTVFALDLSAPGTRIEPIRQATGEHHIATVDLSEVLVPARDVIGAVGSGWQVLMDAVTSERYIVASRGSRDTSFLFERLLGLVVDADFDDPDRRRQLVQLWVLTAGLKATTDRSESALADGKLPGAEVALGKLAYGRLLRKLTRLGLELCGPEALVPASGPGRSGWQEWSNYYLRAPELATGGGTEEIQLNAIAERVLGLPREPRPVTTRTA
jgi:acyl-CoA dehydrogenase